VTFRDLELQQVFQRNFENAQDADSDTRKLCALFAALDWFRITEGEQSSKVQEVMGILLSPDMRTGLRSWYQKNGDDLNPMAMTFREKLSSLVGEKFGSEIR